MAAAISERFGWPVVTLTVTTTTEIARSQVVHAWTRAPDGRAFDAAGFFDEEGYVAHLLADTKRWRDRAVVEHAGPAEFMAHLERCYGDEYGWTKYANESMPGLMAEAAIEVERHLVPIIAESSPAPAMTP